MYCVLPHMFPKQLRRELVKFSKKYTTAIQKNDSKEERTKNLVAFTPHPWRRMTEDYLRGWHFDEFGPPQKVIKYSDDKIYNPICKTPYDVIVEVRASSLNPIDLDICRGAGGEIHDEYDVLNKSRTKRIMKRVKKEMGRVIEPPHILGRDFAGVIREVSYLNSDLNVGDHVWGALNVFHSGSQTEFIQVCPTTDVIWKKPENLTFNQAASIPYVGLTVWSAIKLTGMIFNFKNKKFLVLGGSGGAGTFAIQYLKAYNATVVSTCRKDASILLESLGCDDIIDYQKENYQEEIKAHSPYDCILDFTGSSENSSDNMTQFLKSITGQYITLVSPFISNITQQGFTAGVIKSMAELFSNNFKSITKNQVPTKWASFMPSTSGLKTITKLIEENKIKPVIDQSFVFDDMMEAVKKLEKGHLRGKIVIDHKYSEYSF